MAFTRYNYDSCRVKKNLQQLLISIEYAGVRPTRPQTAATLSGLNISRTSVLARCVLSRSMELRFTSSCIRFF